MTARRVNAVKVRIYWLVRLCKWRHGGRTAVWDVREEAKIKTYKVQRISQKHDSFVA